MTEQQHLITPPPELRRLWAEQARRMYSHDPVAWIEHVATQAARWGWQQRDASVPEELQKARDEELEACCKAFENIWGQIDVLTLADVLRAIRAAMRPKPPSLAEQALDQCNDYIDPDGIIRAALKRLQELEKGNE